MSSIYGNSGSPPWPKIYSRESVSLLPCFSPGLPCRLINPISSFQLRVCTLQPRGGILENKASITVNCARVEVWIEVPDSQKPWLVCATPSEQKPYSNIGFRALLTVYNKGSRTKLGPQGPPMRYRQHLVTGLAVERFHKTLPSTSTLAKRP